MLLICPSMMPAKWYHQVSEPGRRARIVFNLKRDGAAQPWRLATLEQHVERRTGDYDGGASLEACGWGLRVDKHSALLLLMLLKPVCCATSGQP